MDQDCFITEPDAQDQSSLLNIQPSSRDLFDTSPLNSTREMSHAYSSEDRAIDLITFDPQQGNY